MLTSAEEHLVPDGMTSITGRHHFVYGSSPAMRSVERVIADIAPTDIPVLLMGESGTGKEVVALEIHRRSRRSHQAFLKCNCAGLAADSLVAHLSSDGDGYSAGIGGTIFLDEVGQLDPSNQSRLLQLLPDGGLSQSPHSGARVISATTRNLEEQMRAGNFREELYYRINGVSLRLPSLRHRAGDIPVLLDFFLKKYASLFGRPEKKLEPLTMDLLLRHPWPGNVRELENIARKIVALGDEQLALSDLSGNYNLGLDDGLVRPASVSANPAKNNDGGALRSLKEAAREASRKAEHEMILKALERTHWNRKRSARELQISYKALLYKLKQLGLNGAGDTEEIRANSVTAPSVNDPVSPGAAVLKGH